MNERLEAARQRLKQRYMAELYAWLTPSLLYYAFTGNDSVDLTKMDYTLRESLIDKAANSWPERLASIEAQRKQEAQESAALVTQYVLKFDA
jgi:hypothetical protein